ncbi:MAG: RidA family protein [Pseudomonadota bacterium]|nr:RidA family protein [Pseudomonadota bacterium]
MTITRHEQSPILSNVVTHSDTVYTAGVVAKNLNADIAGQTDEVLKEIDRLLKLAGSDRTKILFATIWVPDIRLRAPLNEVWTKWIDKKHLPARACIEAKLADPRALVEIAVVAAK